MDGCEDLILEKSPSPFSYGEGFGERLFASSHSFYPITPALLLHGFPHSMRRKTARAFRSTRGVSFYAVGLSGPPVSCFAGGLSGSE